MVDNINLNKISPLLSSTERIKSVDRKSRNSQQSPFKGAQQGKQKKKKKKKQRPGETPSVVTAKKEKIVKGRKKKKEPNKHKKIDRRLWNRSGD